MNISHQKICVNCSYNRGWWTDSWWCEMASIARPQKITIYIEEHDFEVPETCPFVLEHALIDEEAS